MAAIIGNLPLTGRNLGRSRPAGVGNIGFVGTYPPRRCGIATFGTNLVSTVANMNLLDAVCVQHEFGGSEARRTRMRWNERRLIEAQQLQRRMRRAIAAWEAIPDYPSNRQHPCDFIDAVFQEDIAGDRDPQHEA